MQNNAKAIRNNLERISEGCNDIFDSKNCDFFIDNLNRHKIEIDKDLAYVNHRSIAKRAIFIPLLAIGATIMSLVALLSEHRKMLVSEKTISYQNLENIEKTLNFTTDLANTQNKAIHDIGLNMRVIQERINNNTKAIHKMTEFNDILHMTTLMIFNHQDSMNKFSSYYSGEIHKNFFKIVNIDEFAHKISLLEKDLNNNFTLPPLNIIDMIRILEITSTHNKTHINLIAHIPIAKNNPYILAKIIPIPTIKNGKTYILNNEPELFIQNSEDIKIISHDSHNKCKTAQNITMCNAITYEDTFEPSQCVNALISNTEKDSCTFIEIASKNYIIYMSHNDIYFHIHSPLSLKLTCRNHAKKFNLTSDSHIQFNNQCSITKNAEKTFPKSISQISADPEFRPPELSAYDNDSKKYIELIPLKHHELKLLQTANHSEQTYIEAKKLNFEAKQIKNRPPIIAGVTKFFSKTLPNTFSSITSKIKNFFTDIYDTMVFVVVSCTLIPIILALVIMIICRIKYRKTS